MIYQESVSQEKSISQEEQVKSKKNSFYHKKLIKNKSKGLHPSKPDQNQSQPTDNTINSSMIRSAAALRIFDSQCAKFQRFQNFIKQGVDENYPKEFSKDKLDPIYKLLSQNDYNIQDLLQKNKNLLNHGFPLDQINDYLSLLQKQSQNADLAVVSSKDKNIMISTSGRVNMQLNYIIDLSNQQADILKKRQPILKYYQSELAAYREHQNRMNGITNQNQIKKVSQITTQIIALDHIHCNNKIELKQILQEKLKMAQSLKQQPCNFHQQYVTLLIKKNIKIALSYIQEDILNFYRVADSIEEPQGADVKIIENKRQLDQFLKKKKIKKIRKSRPAILKSACLGCLSHQYQLYNELSYCYECQARFHRLCYTPSLEGLCQNCQFKKLYPSSSNTKNKVIQCVLCPQKGFLYRKINQQQDTNIHIFCMLIHNLWKVDQKLKLKLNQQKYEELISNNKQFQKCSICSKLGNIMFMYKCMTKKCNSFVHPICAYLNGWLMSWNEKQAKPEMRCCPDIQLKENAHRRKFVLNYKKYTYGSNLPT